MKQVGKVEEAFRTFQRLHEVDPSTAEEVANLEAVGQGHGLFLSLEYPTIKSPVLGFSWEWYTSIAVLCPQHLGLNEQHKHSNSAF
jgi:hypothetical protein